MLRPALAVIALLLAACTSTADSNPPAATSSAPIDRPTVPTSAAQTSSRPAASSRTAPAIPRLSRRARAARLVDIRTVVPDALVDLRYATTDNFVGVRLYPIDARCLVHRSMVNRLRTAAARLRRRGYVLVFWDCYRPHHVQVRMFRSVPDPNWVARPGRLATSHEAGRSVDVTLARRSTRMRCARHRLEGHCLLPMGTGFDNFTPRAYAYATSGVSARARADRAVLRNVMQSAGLEVYAGEWWHFDGPGAKIGRAQLHAPLH
jgi:D-alanyl-D-alanine dipeptidase